ncbi:hypothetical protein L249_2301 [Ophiocordyceps polyrhachis-furcata BCC 54312]|uniref:histidine kinase n=1 Tax=Ophiocordyceps polyrhachis-furcata BCC 54312 TaxID=1330021 RepID=A0A367LRE1_9HYPO|nr:hypothetical protein L249_2301 [Ophiocordyceps polyrhachis-furcata BCC 54312]
MPKSASPVDDSTTAAAATTATTAAKTTRQSPSRPSLTALKTPSTTGAAFESSPTRRHRPQSPSASPTFASSPPLAKHERVTSKTAVAASMEDTREATVHSLSRLDSSPGHRAAAATSAPDTHPPTRADHMDKQKAAAGSQQQLNEYREKLARDLEVREQSVRGLLMMPSDKARVSPIPEEATVTSPLNVAFHTSASTESGNTVRGGFTPGPLVGTPSYPFPRMTVPGFSPFYLQKSASPHPLSAGSRAAQPLGIEFRGVLDSVLSGNTTPVTNFAFNPSGETPHRDDSGFVFPDPNLYDLSLMLSAEPGLDAWWSTVVQIMRDVYKAERVTLSIPADSTDVENVPWGQKATYNLHEEDELSMAYMARDGCVMPTISRDVSDVPDADDATQLGTPLRPSLPSRHSFSSYEGNRKQSPSRSPSSARRPTNLTRSKSQLHTFRPPLGEAGQDYTRLNKDALDEHNAVEGQQQRIPSWEAPLMARFEGPGRVLPVLQALDYEADPLIDHTGVIRVLERGRTVALTRSYPYLPTTTAAGGQPTSSHGPSQHKATAKTAVSDPAKRPGRQRAESAPKLSSMFVGPARSKPTTGDGVKTIASRLYDDDDQPRPPTPKFDEYEQAPPSPWSQSPAPSPAVRPDTKENPFFTDATVDESSFDPTSPPTSYSGMLPPEAIGIDNSWTVLHIPLRHVLLSRPIRPFKLDATVMGQRSQGRRDLTEAGRTTPEQPGKNGSAPIAILSILSPIIPYPSNLRRSLEQLAPHLATSFSLCRHYSNLETELDGMQRRRPSMSGFGAVAPYPRHVDAAPSPLRPDLTRQQSVAGSLTSPSDYSAVSKSAAGSPSGTPNWDQSSRSHLVDKRQPLSSPAAAIQGGEGGYFGSRLIRSASTRQEAPHRPRAGSKEDLTGDKRPLLLTAAREMAAEATGGDGLDDGMVQTMTRPTAKQTAADPGGVHTVLHSYGADFASTFQSLPPSSSLLSRPPAASPSSTTTARNSSLITLGADMAPPSDRLKGLILDSLPAHVFVALPRTGETVWVNSRFLSYRGQTVADLAADPWGSIHPDDREEYLKAWSHSLRTGEQFSRTVRIKRFDGAYRWFYARAVASKDKRGVIMQFLGSYMDIHDQHIAELRAARQEEVEASEAKHRLLANLIPQIIFTATEDEGITFANEQWLSYTGQSFDDSLNLGFMANVHPDDLARCRIPTDRREHKGPSGSNRAEQEPGRLDGSGSQATSTSGTMQGCKSPAGRSQLSRSSSSGTESTYGPEPTPDLTELARQGVFKVTTDTSGRLSYTTEVRLRSKTGEYRWHLIRCVEIDTIDFGHGASYYFGSATDINDHKILETKLKEAMESKSRFLSNMSHEIRTPLIGISGMVSFLQDTTLDEEQRDYTNTIQTSANSLIMIINDILDLSKVDAGMMKLKYEWFHTRSLIEDVNELVSTMAIAKRLELNYLVDAEVPAWIKGDKVRIRQVLLNVIGNAIKFTAEGEVFSRCRVYAEEEGGGHREENSIVLKFDITDTGRGFSREEAELIFKPFSQIDGSSTRQHGGSGLGLVISRQLVELHGGRMEGTAEPGKGSTFTFTARFALPTTDDHPVLADSPGSSSTGVGGGDGGTEASYGVPGRYVNGDRPSPCTVSTGSSMPSVGSGRSLGTERSSVSSANNAGGLTRFIEAAKASGQDVSQMRLEMPVDRLGSPRRTATPDLRPPMFSILIVCPQYHSREATTQHIEMTLPKDVPHQITALATAEEAHKHICGDEAIRFTHIVLNLASAEAILDVLRQIARSQRANRTTILILSDSVQRQAVLRLADETEHGRLLTDKQVTFIYKPVKPSRFAVIFDPDRERDLSTDRNRSTAQQMVESQKASYQEIERRMGNKGYKVLLVEDNPVNQKVLTKYLGKIGVDVDIAVDGVECTDKVLSKPHRHYSLILCDLHMPRKDGYQACREIRQWESSGGFAKLPIIALSANVMSDVQEKCLAAGFSDYVTKPVDFIDLSRAMANFF